LNDWGISLPQAPPQGGGSGTTPVTKPSSGGGWSGGITPISVPTPTVTAPAPSSSGVSTAVVGALLVAAAGGAYLLLA